MGSQYFTEKQTIPTIWRWGLFGGMMVFMGFIALMTYQTEWNTMQAEDKWSLLSLIVGPLALLILFFIRLDVRMSAQSIEYKVHPFRKNYRVIPMEKIHSIELKKPTGLKSFQGIGTHHRLRETDINFGGRYRMTLTLDKGRIFSLSTNKPQELKSFLLSLPEGGPKVTCEV